jgi:alcohol dehydrogenase class IV
VVVLSSLGKNCPEQYSELANVGEVNSSAGLNAARKLIANVYDLKKKCVSCHENLNKLRVKLAT